MYFSKPIIKITLHDKTHC